MPLFSHRSTASNASNRGAPQASSYHQGGRVNQQPGFYTPQRNCPPGADPTLWAWFIAVDTDRSGSITVKELQQALINGDQRHFDLDTCLMLMNMFDTDRSGTIGFNEFAALWSYIQKWRDLFLAVDRDNSGTIEQSELGVAFRHWGYNLSPQILKAIELKYASLPPDAYGRPQGINFDRFVRACVGVQHLTASFKKLDTSGQGWVWMNYEQFMSAVLSAP